jgi:hypothetical protein
MLRRDVQLVGELLLGFRGLVRHGYMCCVVCLDGEIS